MNEMNDSQQIFLTAIILGLILGSLVRIVVKNINYHYGNLKAIYDNDQKFKKKQQVVTDMKTRGELHEWITIPSTTGDVMVCKKTGWCPSMQGFLSLTQINSYIANRQADVEYKEFRNARVQLLAHELGLTVQKTEEIVEKVFSIKKDFTVQRLAKLQEDMAAGRLNEPRN